jgi:ABC-2 type transport system ATP-binding protein
MKTGPEPDLISWEVIMSQPIIELRNLSKSYGEVHALQDLSLNINKNSVYGFLGPNGAGKSTTIKVLLGLIRASSGTARIFGKDVARESLSVRSRIGYLPQYPHFYTHMTAREVLDFSLRFYFRGPASKIEDRIDTVLGLVGLEKKADRNIKGFSGGERQRLGIAQAMINFPDLLVLDEPAAALDPIGRKDVLDIMSELKEYTTIFYSTHILDDVQRTSDTVAILNNGRLIAEGPIEELLAGTDGIVYKMDLAGDTETVRNRLIQLPWIETVDLLSTENGASWSITVTDENKAEQHLLREVLRDEQIRVKQFSRMRYELEDVFMRMVEE